MACVRLNLSETLQEVLKVLVTPKLTLKNGYIDFALQHDVLMITCISCFFQLQFLSIPFLTLFSYLSFAPPCIPCNLRSLHLLARKSLATNL